jgi:8-hydroxy-5-deazaflavin:NADPH oxidoreductase
MDRPMEIAIIGAGNVGKALAGALIRRGYTVTIAAQQAEHAAAAAAQTGASSAHDARTAAKPAHAVVLAVPYDAVARIVDELGDVLSGKILIDVTNPLAADLAGVTTEAWSAAEEIQGRVPQALVIKAFNTVLAGVMANPVVDGVPVDGFVAGDDERAKAAVLDLVKSLGYRPIDAGGLQMARVLERMALLNVALQIRNGWPFQTSWKLLGPTG